MLRNVQKLFWSLRRQVIEVLPPITSGFMNQIIQRPKQQNQSNIDLLNTYTQQFYLGEFTNNCIFSQKQRTIIQQEKNESLTYDTLAFYQKVKEKETDSRQTNIIYRVQVRDDNSKLISYKDYLISYFKCLKVENNLKQSISDDGRPA